MTDQEIAHSVMMEPIAKIAEKLEIPESEVIPYGHYMAKINLNYLQELQKQNGKLILVTAMTPTPAGEGKTTVSIGLADALNQQHKNTVLALREPSMGPVFGLKGGAAGGGRSQIVPMENINLHFTGDIHAIGAANNLLAAMTDNTIYFDDPFQFDRSQMPFKRCIDMNDRQLRSTTEGSRVAAKSGVVHDSVRTDSWCITTASETMAAFCLAKDLHDLKKRLARIIVGWSRKKNAYITADDIGATGAMTAILRDAFNPNLVQTLEHTPAFVHGGPFANIAHGCNSIVATQAALKLGDYCVTEAGFGSDLGAEKFLDIKCRGLGRQPDAVVMVATIRALKYHGGVVKADLDKANLDACRKGLTNLFAHVENMRQVYQLPCVVAINKFASDTPAEIKLVEEACQAKDIPVCPIDVWAKGGAGALNLADKVAELANQQPEQKQNHYAYKLTDTIEQKLQKLTDKIYHAKKLEITDEARQKINQLEKLGRGKLPICVAKTQNSLTDAPGSNKITIRDVSISAGAGFVVAYAGKINTMPGLPRHPAALDIDVDDDGDITGIF